MWAHRLMREEPTTCHVSHLPLEGAIPPERGKQPHSGPGKAVGQAGSEPEAQKSRLGHNSSGPPCLGFHQPVCNPVEIGGLK